MSYSLKNMALNNSWVARAIFQCDYFSHHLLTDPILRFFDQKFAFHTKSFFRNLSSLSIETETPTKLHTATHRVCNGVLVSILKLNNKQNGWRGAKCFHAAICIRIRIRYLSAIFDFVCMYISSVCVCVWVHVYINIYKSFNSFQCTPFCVWLWIMRNACPIQLNGTYGTK